MSKAIQVCLIVFLSIFSLGIFASDKKIPPAPELEPPSPPPPPYTPAPVASESSTHTGTLAALVIFKREKIALFSSKYKFQYLSLVNKTGLFTDNIYRLPEGRLIGSTAEDVQKLAETLTGCEQNQFELYYEGRQKYFHEMISYHKFYLLKFTDLKVVKKLNNSKDPPPYTLVDSKGHPSTSRQKLYEWVDFPKQTPGAGDNGAFWSVMHKLALIAVKMKEDADE